MTSLILKNYYFLVTIFSACYSFALIFFLSHRFNYSKPSRAFALFLFYTFLWSVKDAITGVLYPDLSEQSLLMLVVSISPLYLFNPCFAFHMLISVYNATVKKSKRFLYEKQVQISFGLILGSVYVISLIYPQFMYKSFSMGTIDYYYTSGLGIIIFSALVVIGALIPAIMLVSVSFSNRRSEAGIIGIGSLFSICIVFLTNIAPSLFGFSDSPRLGALSISVLCAVTFYGIRRYGITFSIGKVLEERQKLRMIGDSLEGLIAQYDEHAIFQRLCDYALEISESLFVSIVLFDRDYTQYEVQGISCSDHGVTDEVFHRLPLSRGDRHNLQDNSLLSQLIEDPTPRECSNLQAFFNNQLPANHLTEIDRLTHMRQILCYPVVLDEIVCGAVILFRATRTEYLDLYGIFAVQCALILKFSSQIRELEDKRRLEMMLHHSQKMDAIGQLAGGIAHDFNNMLAGISGYANIIRRNYSKNDPKLEKYVCTIIKATDRAADLTNKLLAFARKGKYQMVPVNMHKVIEETINILDRTIDKKIRIRKNLYAPKHTIVGDPTQIQNALINLAINGRDAMPSGGILTFETAVEQMNYTEKRLSEFGIKAGMYLRFSISDSGIGMDETTLAHIYEPFYTTKGVGKGTGLGLASVYGSIKSHGGHISVKSKLGEGTTFSVYLPLADQPDCKKPGTDIVPTVKGCKARILIVDDEEIVRDLFKTLLTPYGYDVFTCADGLEAVEFYEKNFEGIDLVILDMIMPYKNGVETLTEMRSINPSVRAILSTGYDFTEKTQKILTKGIGGFLQKPFDESRLIKAISEALEMETVR
ncbi:MAG: response regulator [Fibrobacterota bacterium]